MRKMQICFARVVKYDTIKDFAAFDNVLNSFSPHKNGLILCYLRSHKNIVVVRNNVGRIL